jgi:hypothetical protein
VAAIVCRLGASALKRDKLIAQIDEGHAVAFAAQFETKETAIEG